MSEPASIAILLNDCRADAAAVVKRHQKDSARQLYTVLTKALHICELCRQDNAASSEVERLLMALPRDGRRRYVEAGSDAYTLVCRYVFAATNHAAVSRYAQTLREGVRRGLNSETLFGYLRDQGGVNALFLARPLNERSVTTRTVRLDRPVTFPKHSVTVLRLQRREDGVFQVLDDVELAA